MGSPSPGDSESDIVSELRAENGREATSELRASSYSNWINEQLSWKETCSLGDWSFFANLRISGPDARELLADLSINSIESFDVGRAKHLVQCNEDGKVLTDGVALCTGEDEFDIHGIPSHWTAYNLEIGDYDVETEWKDTFNIQIQGPNALKVLESVTDDPVRDIDFIHFAPIDINGHEVNAVRFGMGNEIGFELQGPGQYGTEVWNTLFEAGQEYGIRRIGSSSSSIGHLETCFPTRTRDYVAAVFGDEMEGYRNWVQENVDRDILTHWIEGSFDADDISSWYRSPVELGWDNYISFDHDFIGRDALESEVENPSRTIVTLEWDDEDVKAVYASLFENGTPYKYMEMPHQRKRGMIADRVLSDGADVGVATMRGYSYYFRKMLSLCVIDVEYSDPGTEVTVLWGKGGDPASPSVEAHTQKEISATVAPAPYITDKRRKDISKPNQ